MFTHLAPQNIYIQVVRLIQPRGCKVTMRHFNTRPIRLEAKSEKGPRNHFRGDGMLEDVTHASSLV